ncbi:hypothetical protein Tco_0594471, partial [Tanacetum coccineum]
MPLETRTPWGSSSAVVAEASAPAQEDVNPEDAYLELADPDEGTAVVRQGEEVVTEQPEKVRKKTL